MVAMETWFRRVKHTANGMLTTENLSFVEGHAQLKWWKQKSQVIVKTVHLNNEHRGQGLFTAACRQFIHQNSEVHSLMLESVLEPELIEKLLTRGWRRAPFDKCNLLLN